MIYLCNAKLWVTKDVMPCDERRRRARSISLSSSRTWRFPSQCHEQPLTPVAVVLFMNMQAVLISYMQNCKIISRKYANELFSSSVPNSSEKKPSFSSLLSHLVLVNKLRKLITKQKKFGEFAAHHGESAILKVTRDFIESSQCAPLFPWRSQIAFGRDCF